MTPARRTASVLAVALITLTGCPPRGDGGVRVEDMWARPTIVLEAPMPRGEQHNRYGEHPGVEPKREGLTALYMVIHNDGREADRLIGVETEVAQTAELHRTTVNGGVKRMELVPSIDLPAGGRVALEPGGYHVMLIGLRRPLRAGGRFPVTLVFERAGRLHLEAEVRETARHQHRY